MLHYIFVRTCNLFQSYSHSSITPLVPPYSWWAPVFPTRPISTFRDWFCIFVLFCVPVRSIRDVYRNVAESLFIAAWTSGYTIEESNLSLLHQLFAAYQPSGGVGPMSSAPTHDSGLKNIIRGGSYTDDLRCCEFKNIRAGETVQLHWSWRGLRSGS